MAKPSVCMRAASLLAVGLLLAGCTSHPAETPDERLRRQAAQDAAQVHHDVKQAGQEAKKALGAAGRETRDIVAGARQGWREGAAKDGPIVSLPGRVVDINHASVEDLQKLPGIHAATARRISNGKPYQSTDQLVSQHLLTREEYDRIRDRITAR